jgi:hypothetical protein
LGIGHRTRRLILRFGSGKNRKWRCSRRSKTADYAFGSNPPYELLCVEKV